MDFEEKILNYVETEYNYYQNIKLLVDKVGVAFEAMPEGLLLELGLLLVIYSRRYYA